MKNTKTVKWFKNVNTIEELKKEYKQLAKKYHPDLNLDKDTTKEMTDINNEYDYLYQILHSEKDTKKGHTKDSNNFKEMINKIIAFNCDISIVGSWIWVYGETYSIKDQLKELGFKWSKSNKKWYYTEEEITFKKKKATTWDYKTSKYGENKIKNTEESLKIKG